MGTNFYLKSRIPRQVYDKYHIAKTSVGWRPLFQENPEGEFGWNQYPEPMEIRSVSDIKRAYDTGTFAIVDEYGDEYTWEQFEKRVLGHCPDGQAHVGDRDYPIHVDENGYEFAPDDFC